MKAIKYIVVFFLLLSSAANAQKYVKILPQQYYSPASVIVQRVILNANNISAYFQNTGIFNQNTSSANSPGLEWPKGANKYAMFTSGLCIGCGITGQYAQVMASYKGEYAPGRVQNGVFYTDNDFKIYTVRLGDNETNNPDYANWYKMVPYGAPYVDRNNNGVYDQGVDLPGVKDAAQTVFEVMTDMDVTAHSPGEGFGGGITNPLLKAEIAWTSWAYTSPGLEDIQFIKWRIINKGSNIWDSTFMGVVTDPDLGDALDDYIGCDTVLNLGYCYNADNNDAVYGQSPPAVGLDYFRGTVKKNTNDTLGLTSLTFFTGTSAGGPPCETDPNGEPIGAYHFLQGLKKDRTPYMDITKIPPKRTKFCYYGDPETNSGWTESKGSMQNCNGDTTGTIISVNPSGDKRFVMGSGRIDLRIFPNDTQSIIVAQFVARGSSNLNSVTRLKSLSRTAQIIYDSNFDVIPKPPVPYVYQSVTPVNQTTCNLNVYWNDAAESFYFWDTIFYQKNDSNIYEFEGYEIYEVNKNLPVYSLPDFSRPTTINPNQIKLVKIFDKRNNIGVVIDTLPTGVIINGNELYSPMPIVPPYGLGMPTDFPNNGLSRLIKINQTLFPENYGGNSAIQYGQTYKYIVGAYAVSKSTRIRKGFKVIRTTLGTALFNVQPQPYSSNITFNMFNGDTIKNNRIDLGLVPVVVGQQYLQNARYRIAYAPDTSYSILKSVNNGVSYSVLKTGLKPSSIRTTAHDDSRIYDGILFRTETIRFSGTPPLYSGNVGMIKDPTLAPDSIQTRHVGWEWSNPANPFLTGSKFLRDPARQWQSRTQSISYPMSGTFTNLRSALTAQQLRKVTIQWTAPGLGQYAYWYQDSSKANNNFYIFKGMKPVPFKVFVDTLIGTDPTLPSFRIEKRQVNCAFVESADVNPFTNGWNPTTDSLGGKLLLYTFSTSYSDTITTPYKNRNLFLQQSQFDINFVWSPRLVNSGGAGQPGEEFLIYPYTVTRPYYNGVSPLFYEFSTTAPTVPVIEIITEVPEKYDLMQNYPNPFNPVTKIKFSIMSSPRALGGDLVQLKIYNVMGREVKTLVNEILKPGTYETTFDGSALSSGVYFYQLITNDFIQTKRMVLLK